MYNDDIGGVFMKVQISLNENLVEKIDNYAELNFMSRSGMISFACS